MRTLFDRCQLECCSDDRDYAACDGFHQQDEHDFMGYCVNAGMLAHGCDICQNALTEDMDTLNDDTLYR